MTFLLMFINICLCHILLTSSNDTDPAVLSFVLFGGQWRNDGLHQREDVFIHASVGAQSEVTLKSWEEECKPKILVHLNFFLKV